MNNRWALRIVILAVLFVIFTCAFFLFRYGAGGHEVVHIGDAIIDVEVVKTKDDRTKGLGGRESLLSQQGMLFVFDNESRWGIWMKDMKFAIDIIWMNSSKKVVHIEENVKPESYPRVFAPGEDARYVLEVNAGLVKSKNIMLGQTAKF